MRLSELRRQWRVARAEAKEGQQFLRDRRDAEHEERLRARIKDPQAGGTP